MLQITVPLGIETFDDLRQEFIYPETFVLDLEHNLLSISKWESKWNRSFLSKTKKTEEETIDYIRCMTLNEVVPMDVYNYLTNDNIKRINEYIEAPMTATYFFDSEKEGGTKETVTAELIYYWMISLNIPFECEQWHLNRLLALIRVCNIKNAPPDKKGRKPNIAARKAMNEARKAQHNSKG